MEATRAGKRAADAQKYRDSVVDQKKADQMIDEAVGELRQKERDIKGALNKQHGKFEGLRRDLAEVQKQITELETLKKAPNRWTLVVERIKAGGEKLKAVKGEMLNLAQRLQKAGKKLGYIVSAGAFFLALVDFQARADERGVGYAIGAAGIDGAITGLSAVPYLGQMVIVGELLADYTDEQVAAVKSEAREFAQGQEWSNAIKEAWREGLAKAFARKETIAAYDRIASKIMVSRPDYVDLNAVAEAVRIYHDKMLSKWMTLFANGDFQTMPQDAETVTRRADFTRRADAELERNLRKAANQPVDNREQRPVY